MKSFDYRHGGEQEGSEEVYSKPVRAGRRTYFFDVKATRGGDYFLTITESRKKNGDGGSFSFEKQKLHLYKEDFQKFQEGFEEVVNYIREHKPESFHPDGSAISHLGADHEG